ALGALSTERGFASEYLDLDALRVYSRELSHIAIVVIVKMYTFTTLRQFSVRGGPGRSCLEVSRECLPTVFSFQIEIYHDVPLGNHDVMFLAGVDFLQSRGDLGP